jgi:hypothetical protein
MNLFMTFPIPSDPIAIPNILSTLRQAAEAYWRGQESAAPFVEILTETLNVDGWGPAPMGSLPSSA